MFKTSIFSPHFQPTQAGALESAWALPTDRWARLRAPDPIEEMAQADAADRSLLRLVACAAGATLLLALATSMV